MNRPKTGDAIAKAERARVGNPIGGIRRSTGNPTFDVLQQGPIPEITAAKMFTDIALKSVDFSLIGWPFSVISQ